MIKLPRFLPLTFLFLAAMVWLVPGQGLARHTRDASIGLYLVPAQGTCAQLPLEGCVEDIKLSGEVTLDYYAILAVFNGDPEEGFAGVSCGIDYDGVTNSGVDVFDWNVCANGLQFPNGNWPEPGGGNRITWLNDGEGCQTTEPTGDGVTAMAGYFFVHAYSPDRMSVTENVFSNGKRELAVSECIPPVRYLLDPETRAGHVEFSDDGSEPGHLPCVDAPENTTWGRIKNTYGN